MVNKHYKKTKKSFKSKHRKGTNYFFEEKEIKTVKNPGSNIKIFLKKKNKKSLISEKLLISS